MSANDNLSFLQISDLHVSSKNTEKLKRRFKALGEVIREKKWKPNFIIISGDVANFGLASEYEIAQQLVNDFIKELSSLTCSDIFVVPGNHDVDRTMIDDIYEEGLVHRLQSSEAADEVWQNISRRKKILERQSSFFRFCENNGFQYEAKTISVSGYKIGIAPINSAWRSASDEDKNKLFYSQSQLEELCDKIKDSDFKISISHHPSSWLHESETFPINQFIARNFHVHCCGHRHIADAFQEIRPDGSTYINTCRAFHASNMQNGFSYFELELNTRKLCVSNWMYIETRQKFAADTEFSDDGTQSTFLSESLSAKPSLITFRQKQANISVQYTDLLNQSLKAIAPKLNENLEKLVFFPPTCVSRENDNFLLEDIIKRPENVIISGVRFSGRTSVLLKLSSMFTKRGIPTTFFDFQDIKSFTKKHELHKFIRKKLGVTSSDLDHLINSELVFLIDNVDCSSTAAIEAFIDLIGSSTASPPRCIWTRLSGDITAISDNKQESEASSFLGKFIALELSSPSISQIQDMLLKISDSSFGLSLQPNMISSFVQATFQNELPRLPWILLVFFELYVNDEDLMGVNIGQLIAKYISYKLYEGDGPGQLSFDMKNMALKEIAKKMISTSRLSLDRGEILEVLGDYCRKKALELPTIELISSLLDSGLVFESKDGVSFTLVAFTDYFCAKSFVDSPELAPVAGDFSEQILLRYGGVLGYLSSIKPDTERIKAAFSITRQLAPDYPTTIELDDERLSNIEIIDSSLGEAYEEESEEEASSLDDDINLISESRKGIRAKQISGKFSTNSFSNFLETLRYSLAMLRNGTFLDSEAKESSVESGVDFVMIIANTSLAAVESLEQRLSDSESQSSVLKELLPQLTAILIWGSKQLVVTWGSAKHLEITLIKVFHEESDPFRKMVLITWLTTIGSNEVMNILNKFVKTSSSYFTLCMLEGWLYNNYLSQGVLEGRPSPLLEKALYETSVARVQLGVKQMKLPSASSSQHANNTAQKMISDAKKRMSVHKTKKRKKLAGAES